MLLTGPTRGANTGLSAAHNRRERVKPVHIYASPRPSRLAVLWRKAMRHWVCPLLGHRRKARGSGLLWCPRCNLVWEDEALGKSMRVRLTYHE